MLPSPRTARLLLSFLAVGLSSCILIPTPASAQFGGRREAEIITWATGVVHDEAGKPIAGAKVFARGTYSGGIRTNALLHSATTDDDGRYAIQGAGGLSMFSAALVAHIAGRPPALAWISMPGPPLDGLGFPVDLPPHDPTLDFVIPSRCGQLKVLVTRDGKLATGATVALRLEGADPFDHWGRDVHGNKSDQDELFALCRPTQRTGPDGIAQFDNLLPGLYSILAEQANAARALTDYTHRWFPFREPPTYGESRHIPVRVGDTTTHHIALFQHGCVTKFEIIKDGKNWIAQERLHPDNKSLDGYSGGYMTWIGQEWTDTFRFESAGIELVNFKKYTGSSKWPRDFPFVSADVALAASPRLSQKFPIALAAQENRGGSVFVRLQDAAGRPLSGSARFGDRSFENIATEGGRLTGFEPGTGMLEGQPRGVRHVFPWEYTGPFPSDDELFGRFEILPQRVTIGMNEEPVVTMRSERVGYVRGRLVPTPGRKPADYELSLSRHDLFQGAKVYYKRGVGEFLAGPYRTGTANLVVSHLRSRFRRAVLRRQINVQAGSLTLVELAPPEDDDSAKSTDWKMNGHVLSSDGGTPAHLAAVAKFFPEEDRPWGLGRTDFQGRIWPHTIYAAYRETEQVLPGTPTERVAIAWLPGRCGAAIVPLPRIDLPLSITLPPPIAIHGKVEVAGDGQILTKGTIQVRAQYEGRGKLNDLLSLETTAGADGNFELAGLTPGVYRVQAALDGIWLSPSVALTVGDAKDQPLPPLSLTIPPPGGPVLVRLPSPPLASPEKLTVLRPAGPLTDRLWPKSFTPDGAGVIRIPALEAGRHILQIGTTQKTIDVPPLQQSHGAPLEISWTL